MIDIWLYSLVSVFVVSLLSFLGLATFKIGEKKIKRFLIYVISFSAGALFGDAFFHLMPELVDSGFGIKTSFYLVLGIVIFFVLEKLIHNQHYHHDEHDHSGGWKKEKKVKPFAYVNLVGSGLHNFIDGTIIAASYIVSMEAGIATTFAIFLHEIPHELGDFGILIHGGFSKGKALFVNFLSALVALLGAVFALWLQSYAGSVGSILLPIATGGLIYIAGSDLIPELHREHDSSAFWQTVWFIFGIALLASLILIE